MMSKKGTPQSPLRIAVVGAGPSGFYAAEALLKEKTLSVQVDIFDRLPSPYGLVRYGVAPDHQKIKGVVAVYEKVALTPGFRFFGNVKIGRDLQVDDLRAYYDMIVYAVGNESDRKLDIPGEHLQGIHSATSFVFWYNGHPDYRDENFDLSCESAAVVGIGNVAMDVTRVLAQDPRRLEATDIADYALAALRESKLKTIWLLGRRGPAQAAFSPSEIQEIGDLEYADLIVESSEVALGAESQADYADPTKKKNVDYVQKRALISGGTKPRQVRLRFCVAPVEAIGDGERLQAIRIEKTRLVSGDQGRLTSVGTGEFEIIPARLVFRSIGYRGIPIPGVPFDEKLGRIRNDGGRVVDESGIFRPGEFVVGWAKRGPVGLIGTNRADSCATVKAMLEDAVAGRLIPSTSNTSSNAVTVLLQSRQVRFVTFSEWQALDKLELQRGAIRGRVREKFASVSAMLAALHGDPE